VRIPKVLIEIEKIGGNAEKGRLIRVIVKK
jgi:hypothetical protein